MIPTRLPTSIVCDTDLSCDGRRAEQVAALLAARLCAAVHVVHVVDELGAADALAREGDCFAPERDQLRIEAMAMRRMGAIVAEHLVAGPRRLRLTEIAAMRRGELLVMAHRPVGVWGRLVADSVERAVAEASIPVLVVEQPERLLSWLRGERPLRVVIGLAPSSPSASAVNWAHRLGSAGLLEVVAALVCAARDARDGPRLEAMDGGSAHPYRENRRARRSSADALSGKHSGDEMLAHLLSAPVVARAEVEVVTGDPAPSLIELARQREADLIVVDRSLSRRGPWRARAWRGLLRSALPCSVACVPASYAPVDERERHPRLLAARRSRAARRMRGAEHARVRR